MLCGRNTDQCSEIPNTSVLTPFVGGSLQTATVFVTDHVLISIYKTSWT